MMYLLKSRKLWGAVGSSAVFLAALALGAPEQAIVLLAGGVASAWTAQIAAQGYVDKSHAPQPPAGTGDL